MAENSYRQVDWARATQPIGVLGRQDEEFQASRLAFGFEDGLELGSAIDRNAADRERRFAQEVVEQRLRADCARLGGNAAERPFGDRIIGSDVRDRLVGPNVHEERVDLPAFARRLGLAPFGQAAGGTLFGGEADSLRVVACGAGSARG